MDVACLHAQLYHLPPFARGSDIFLDQLFDCAFKHPVAILRCPHNEIIALVNYMSQLSVFRHALVYGTAEHTSPP